MHYNILYEPWLPVRYINGETKLIGVRQAFIDAKQIREVLAPVMYGNKLFFVAFTDLHLLAIIVMAANYKPENNFAAKRQDIWEEQLARGMNLKTVLDYLDRYEDRFDIFSDKYPFLQNIQYAAKVVGHDMLSKPKITQQDIKYISNSNPFAPGANNPLSGARRTYTSGHDYPVPLMHYQMTPADFAQVLVYSPWYASSSPGQYPVSLYNQTTMVVSPVGKNLEETILRHCIAIPHSSRPNADDPDALYDRPRWEWDNEEECFLHPRSDMLANSFFNGVELLAAPRLNAHGFIEYVYVAPTPECLHPTKPTKYPAFNRSSEQSAALCYNPYTIREIFTLDDGTVQFAASQYNLSKTAASIFLAATKHLDDGNSAHILDSNQDASSIRLYYRTYSDAYHAVVDNQGVLEMPAVAIELMNPDKHTAATLFQNKYSKICKPLAKALRMIDLSDANVSCRMRELSHIAKAVFLQTIEAFRQKAPSEYEAVVNEHIAQIKQETRRILEEEGRMCRSAIKYNDAWDHLLKNTHKI